MAESGPHLFERARVQTRTRDKDLHSRSVSSPAPLRRERTRVRREQSKSWRATASAEVWSGLSGARWGGPTPKTRRRARQPQHVASLGPSSVTTAGGDGGNRTPVH